MTTKVAVVLAAGEGVRMGGSKALLVVDGAPLARVHAARAVEAGCDRVIVVVRPDVAERLGDIPRATMVAEQTSSQAESLRWAVRKIGARGDVRVLVTPADCPPVAVDTLHALFRALDDGADVATPLRDGKGGHPVACRVGVLAPYLAKEGDAPTLRDVLAKNEAGRVRVDVDDPRVGVDLDTPADVVALTGAPPRFA